jgi:2-polyprenyl-3-methyl-5-hydroxy-6-metoxy-1,4-benzoquinol methylase
VYDELRPFLSLKGKKILDIGCGTGSFLSNFKSHNEVLGIEVSEAYRQYLEANGIPYRIGNLEDILSSIPDSYFDLITLWDVFEHLEAPGKMLTIIKEKLSPKGSIIIWTNNYDDCISLFAAAVYRVSLGKLPVLAQKSFNREGGHNYNFVSKSLEFLYRKNKLKIIRSIKTDTPSKKLTNNVLFRGVLELFYLMNKLSGKGKIICHILKHDEV